jgi:hypothetical protein
MVGLYARPQFSVKTDWDANTAVIYLVNPPPVPRRGASHKIRMVGIGLKYGDLSSVTGFLA